MQKVTDIAFNKFQFPEQFIGTLVEGVETALKQFESSRNDRWLYMANDWLSILKYIKSNLGGNHYSIIQIKVTPKKEYDRLLKYTKHQIKTYLNADVIGVITKKKNTTGLLVCKQGSVYKT